MSVRSSSPTPFLSDRRFIKALLSLLAAPYTLWLVLAGPSFPLIYDLTQDNRYYAEIMHVTGVFSVQLVVATLAVTPLLLILKYLPLPRPFHSGLGRWLLKSRRYLGVASFGYAVLHLIFYIRETKSLTVVWLEAFDIAFLVGWLAFLAFVPLALTSNNLSVRVLGKSWKVLQRLVYPAAFLTFLHWFYFDFFWTDASFWMLLLIGAKGVQVLFRLFQKIRSKRKAFSVA